MFDWLLKHHKTGDVVPTKGGCEQVYATQDQVIEGIAWALMSKELLTFEELVQGIKDADENRKKCECKNDS